MNSYNAIILGCGKIAGGYDNPGDEVILTHAHAISKSSKITLAGVYDIHTSAAEQMSKKWNTKAYSSIHEIFKETKPDIVVVAVPDDFHEEMLETLQHYSPKIIICEKPLGKNLIRLRGILAGYKSRNIEIAVNFSRNYDQRIVRLKEEISAGTYGELLNGILLYSKGLRHNGSHAISLLRYMFGAIKSFKILDRRIDYKADDPTIDLQILFEDGTKCYLLAGDESKYSIFEWQFLYANARFIFKKDGFQLCSQEIIDDPLFPGYKTLGEEMCEETALKQSMRALYQNVLSYLETGEVVFCTAEDALATQSVIERIFDHLNV